MPDGKAGDGEGCWSDIKALPCFVSVGCYMTEVQDKYVFLLNYLIYYEAKTEVLP